MTRALQCLPFRAMGTLCLVAATSEPDDLAAAARALAAARCEVEACERALSRFDARSDLSRLNRASGAWVEVDSRLGEALVAAVRAREETGGLFDPTILPALEAAGYDRSFEYVGEREATPLGDWRAGARVEVDKRSGRARLQRGASVDLGGIGKGFASARALRAMRASWPALPGAIVDLGGDIGVWGAPPEGGPWRVDVADPRAHHGVAATLELTGGGVATSGRDTRRFGPGLQLHHLIDPMTGASAVAGPLAVTVVAEGVAEAEAHATALAITETDDARAYLARRPELSGLLIPQFGEPIAIGGLPLVHARPRSRIAINTQKGRFTWH